MFVFDLMICNIMRTRLWVSVVLFVMLYVFEASKIDLCFSIPYIILENTCFLWFITRKTYLKHTLMKTNVLHHSVDQIV